MTYLLDTTILIDLKKGTEAARNRMRKFADLPQSTPFITLFTYSEYYFGNIRAGEQRGAVDFLGQFRHVTLSQSSARLFAELNYKYKKAGVVFETIDLLNAAIAIDENMIFVTSDRFFENINELRKIII